MSAVDFRSREANWTWSRGVTGRSSSVFNIMASAIKQIIAFVGLPTMSLRDEVVVGLVSLLGARRVAALPLATERPVSVTRIRRFRRLQRWIP
jgi:hypothetical protein